MTGLIIYRGRVHSYWRYRVLMVTQHHDIYHSNSKTFLRTQIALYILHYTYRSNLYSTFVNIHHSLASVQFCCLQKEEKETRGFADSSKDCGLLQDTFDWNGQIGFRNLSSQYSMKSQFGCFDVTGFFFLTFVRLRYKYIYIYFFQSNLCIAIFFPLK